MPPSLPDRYRLEVRLGRVDDVEEWLATDTTLDRPVLVRVLGPEASADRSRSYLTSVRAVAATNHVHLASVFTAGSNESGSYAVLEWNGGITIEDRLRAGETIPVEEFLPNAAGLASGLAALHAAGTVHGAVGPETILYSTAHPAKLAGYGAPRRAFSTGDDVAALADALALAVAGAADVRPSQIADGLPKEVDDALDAARSGVIDAAGLANAMRAAPSTPPPAATTASGSLSWRWLIPASALLVAALVVAAIGLAITPDRQSPFLFPATPPRSPVVTDPPQDAAPEVEPVAAPGSLSTLSFAATVHDPFGDQQENDALLADLSDGDATTAWRTETYRDPVSALKAGVGVAFDVDGVPASLEVIGSEGSRYTVSWADNMPTEFGGWEQIASGTLLAGRTRIQLPERPEGHWLLWFTDLPEVEEDRYRAALNEVRWLQ